MRIATICPTCATLVNALCVIYDGDYLANIGAEPGDTLEDILAKINAALPSTTTTSTSTSTSTSSTTTTTTTTAP
jgi:hypothetical protein